MKKQSGITLIVLIITIIVMLILVGVSINVFFGDGLFGAAKEGAEATTMAKENELEISDGMIDVDGMKINIDDYIAGLTGEDWVESSEGSSGGSSGGTSGGSSGGSSGGVTISRGDTTLKVGQYVNYQEPINMNYDGGWRVLGVNNQGKLLLISSEPVKTSYMIKGKNGYENGTTLLNDICAGYADGVMSKKARCITMEDINKVTGYNPKNVGVKDPSQSGEGTYYTYGGINYQDKVTYRVTSTGIAYSKNGGNEKPDTRYTAFYPLGSSTSLISGDVNSKYTVEKSQFYAYYPTTLKGQDTNDESQVVGISKTSDAYDMLFNRANYWIANTYIGARDGYVDYGLFRMFDKRISLQPFWYSYASKEHGGTFDVVAVVELEKDVNFDTRNPENPAEIIIKPTRKTVAELEVGEYVDYKYTASSININAQESGLQEYANYKEDSSYAVSQTFNSADNVKITRWRVISNDNGVVKLMGITELGGDEQKLFLAGQNGYLNGVTILNRICETLYSGKYGTATSVNLDHVNKATGNVGTDKIWFFGPEYNPNVTRDNYRVYPQETLTIGDLVEEYGECGTIVPGGGNINDLVLNNYNFNPSDFNPTLTWSNLTAPLSVLFEDAKSGDTSQYWVAGMHYIPSYHPTSEEDPLVRYCLKIIGDLELGSRRMCDSLGGILYRKHYFRPIVTLNTGLTLQLNSSTDVWSIVE